MPNFVDDDTDLPYPKNYLKSAPPGKEVQYIQAKDWNILCQAVVDLRAFARSLSDSTITTGAGLSGSGSLASGITIELEDTDVTPGTYTSADITVDAQGRITAASSGAGGGVPTARSITAGTGLTGGGDLTADRTLSLSDTGVTAGTYDAASVVVDAKGRVTGATSLWFNVQTFGAVGDGVTDCRLSIQAALAAANVAGGGIVFFPKGTYMVSKAGSFAWALDLTRYSNITLQGVKGASWIKLQAGQPGSSVVTIRLNESKNITFRDMGIDGNWGNTVTMITASSHSATLPQATINVEDTTGIKTGAAFPSSGTIQVMTDAGMQTVTYTGKTATSFTGCSGGTGKMTGQQSYFYDGALVGYSDSQAGINHTTQGDPQSHTLFVRGCENVTIDNCIIRQAYGDGIWCGRGGTDAGTSAKNINITKTVVTMCARDGISFPQKCSRIRISECEVTNIFTQAIDTEPVGVGEAIRDVHLTRSHFGSWWGKTNPGKDVNCAVTICGPAPYASELDAARNFRVTDCTLDGALLIQKAIDVIVRGCRIVTDWDGLSYAPIVIQMVCDDVQILDNYIYHRTSGWNYGIVCHYYSSGIQSYQPKGVVLRGNRIHVRNSNGGILIDGTSGTEFGGAEQSGTSGTATGVSGNTVTNTSATWTTNQWIGFRVTLGGAAGTIASNTATTFTVDAWSTPGGDGHYVPTAGTYTILSGGSIIDVDNNLVDCTDDGNKAGGKGITITAGRAGMRCRVRGNEIKNAVGDCISVSATTRQIDLLEITKNVGWNNTGSPTTNLISITANSFFGKLIVSGNTKDEGVTNAFVGLTSGRWILEDGEIQRWAGYGVPNGAIAARVGSMYHRRDEGGAAALWIKQSFDDSDDGWVRLTKPRPEAWSVDEGSGIAVPANATEWTNLITSAGLNGIVAVPDALYLCQETSGNLTDSIGTFTLTATGSLVYQQPLSAWTRKACGTVENLTGYFASTDAGLPDMSASPITFVAFAMHTQATPNTTRSMMTVGTGANANSISYLGGGTSTKLTSGANVATATGTQMGTIRPYWIKHVPGSSLTTGGENLNRLTPSFSNLVTGKRMALGGFSTIAPPSARFLYAWAWFGDISNANLKTILQQMGWIIDWT